MLDGLANVRDVDVLMNAGYIKDLDFSESLGHDEIDGFAVNVMSMEASDQFTYRLDERTDRDGPNCCS